HLSWQFVIEIDTGDDVEAGRIEGQRLSITLLKRNRPPVLEVAPCFIKIGLAQIGAYHLHRRKCLRELIQKAAAPAGNIEELQLTLIAAAHEACDRRDCLAAHGTCGPHEEGFNLNIVELR